MSGFINTVVVKTKEYIDKCDERIEFHNNNAKNSTMWNNFLNTSNIMLSGLNIFVLSILTVVGAGSIPITVCASTFSLLLMIGQKIKDDYSFKSLSYLHYSSVDSYSELKQTFIILLNDIEKHKFNEADFDNLLIKYEGILAKSHHQTIKDCKICCCFKTTNV